MSASVTQWAGCNVLRPLALLVLGGMGWEGGNLLLMAAGAVSDGTVVAGVCAALGNNILPSAVGFVLGKVGTKALFALVFARALPVWMPGPVALRGLARGGAGVWLPAPVDGELTNHDTGFLSQ